MLLVDLLIFNYLHIVHLVSSLKYRINTPTNNKTIIPDQLTRSVNLVNKLHINSRETNRQM